MEMQKKIYYVGTNAQEFRKNIFRKYMFLMAVALTLICTVVGYAMYQIIDHYESQIATMQAQFEVQLTEQVGAVETRYKAEVSNLNAQIDQQNVVIEAMENTLNQERADSAEVFEIARKYWYVFRDAPDNSGLTMDDMVYLDSLCKERDLNPHIMWCIYDNESGYTEAIDNYSGSSARGLGQVLKSTGESIYENILQLGTYSHEYAYDAQVNMQITVELIDRNIDSGLYNAIALYSGDSSGGYYNRILATATDHGVSLSDTGYQ